MATGYQLEFMPEALKEWAKLDKSIQKEFKNVLRRRLATPRVQSARLSGKLHNCFKIKSKKSGMRLIYTVVENKHAVVVLAVGARDELIVYNKAQKRILKS